MPSRLNRYPFADYFSGFPTLIMWGNEEMDFEELAKRLSTLDREQRLLRTAAQKLTPRQGWLRDVRQTMGFSASEIARKMGMNRSEVFRMEERETRKRITLESLEKMAEALDCRMIYAVIPKKGTFEDLLLRRLGDEESGEDGSKYFRDLVRFMLRMRKG